MMGNYYSAAAFRLAKKRFWHSELSCLITKINDTILCTSNKIRLARYHNKINDSLEEEDEEDEKKK